MQPQETAPEPFITIAEAAKRLGIHYWALQRAVRRGDVPSYRVFNSRRRVRLSEVIVSIVSVTNNGDYHE